MYSLFSIYSHIYDAPQTFWTYSFPSLFPYLFLSLNLYSFFVCFPFFYSISLFYRSSFIFSLLLLRRVLLFLPVYILLSYSTFFHLFRVEPDSKEWLVTRGWRSRSNEHRKHASGEIEIGRYLVKWKRYQGKIERGSFVQFWKENIFDLGSFLTDVRMKRNCAGMDWEFVLFQDWIWKTFFIHSIYE